MGRHAAGIEDTRAALVEAAWSLFSQTGYETATVEAIAARAGVSKGAFYHHFASKQEMLDAVAQRIAESFFRSLRPELDDSRVPAATRLSRLLASMRAWRLEHMDIVAELLRTLYRDENLRLRVRINRGLEDLSAPVLAGLIREGVTEGVFTVQEPEAAARMLLRLSVASTEDLLALVEEGASQAQLMDAGMRYMEGNLQAFERLLAAPAGCLGRPDRSTVHRLCGLFAAAALGRREGAGGAREGGKR